MSVEERVKCGGCPEPCTNQCGDCTKFFCACPPTSRISYSIWANEQAFWAGWIILGGTIIASSLDLRPVLPTGLGLQTRFVLIPVSLLIIFLEYPRGKKRRGNILERPFQQYVAPIHYFFRFLTRNLLIRGFLYLFFSIPCFFILSTNLGGMALVIAAMFYLIGGCFNESWVPPSLAYGPGSKAVKYTPAFTTMLPMAPNEEVPLPPVVDSEEIGVAKISAEP